MSWYINSFVFKGYQSYIFRIQTCLDWNCHCWIFPLVTWLELSQSWMNVVWIPNAFPVPPLSCDFQLSLLLTLLGEKEVNIYILYGFSTLSLSLSIFSKWFTSHIELYLLIFLCLVWSAFWLALHLFPEI